MTMRCDDCINRRQFLTTAAGAAGLVAISACGDGVVTGPFADLPAGPVSIVVGDFPGLATVGTLVKVPQQPISVKRTAADSFEALSMICTHAGCQITIVNSGQAFNCSCHGSRFDNGGAVTNGPADAPLPKFITSYDPATDTLTIS
jgi:Rieske Fe-S protein